MPVPKICNTAHSIIARCRMQLAHRGM